MLQTTEAWPSGWGLQGGVLAEVWQRQSLDPNPSWCPRDCFSWENRCPVLGLRARIKTFGLSSVSYPPVFLVHEAEAPRGVGCALVQPQSGCVLVNAPQDSASLPVGVGAAPSSALQPE